MPIGPAVIEGAGMAVEALGNIGTNMTNYRIAKEDRSWKERMDNTKVQRGMKDLEAAGINPILAGRHAGSVPGTTVPTMQNPAQGVATSAGAIARINSDVAKVKSDVSLNKALETKALEEAETQASIRDTNTALQGVHQQNILESKARSRKIERDMQHTLNQIEEIEDRMKTARLGREVTNLKMEREKLFNKLFKEGNEAVEVYKGIYDKLNIDKPVKAFYDLRKVKDKYNNEKRKARKNPLKYVGDEFMKAIRTLKK